jgi:hypothetical protein
LRRPYPLTCWLLFALAAAGVFICALAMVGVWYAASRARQLTSDVASRIDSALARVEDRCLTAEGALDRTSETLQPLRTALAEVTTAVARDRAVETLTALEAAVAPALERTDDILQSAASLIDLISGLLGSEPAHSLGGGDAPVIERLAGGVEAARSMIAETSAEVAALRQRAAEVEGRAPTAAVLVKALTLVARLETIQGRIASLRVELTNVRARVATAADSLRWRIIVAAFALTLLAVWFAAGQLCLAAFGRRRKMTSAAFLAG